MNALTNYLKKLEKKGIIGKTPHPVIPLLITFIFYLFSQQEIPFFSPYLHGITIFAFVFAVIHLIIYKVLTKK